MANELEEEEEKKGGGGHDNRLAYGLLIGAGVDVNGLSPSEAWELVSQLNLLESKRWKRTDEDKQRIKEKNSQVKAGGNTFESIEKMAQTYSRAVDFSGVGNLAALKDTVDAMSGVMSDYSLNAMLERSCCVILRRHIESVWMNMRKMRNRE